MFKEAMEAPAKVREFLRRDGERYADLGARLRALRPACVGTIARGSSDHAAAYAKYLLPLCTGRVVASIPPSLVTVLDAPLDLSGQFVLSLSQSGGSPDIVSAVGRARRSGALTACVVNNVQSPLARTAELVFDQHAGPETSITATKSVLCTLAAIARIAGEWAQDPALLGGLHTLPDVLARAADAAAGLDEKLLATVSHAYVLSRGLGFGAGAEIALKLKETCGLHAEAFSTAEVRHGPREIVDGRFLVIALAFPGSGGDDVVKAARELEAQGARVLLVGATEQGGQALPAPADPRLAPLVALQFLYPWIARSAVALGRNPDKPKTLASKVIETI